MLKELIRLKRLWVILLFPIGILLTYLATVNPTNTEIIFSSAVYKVFSQIVSMIFGIFPISIAEILLVGGVLSVLFFLGFSIFRCIKKKTPMPIFKYVINLLVASSVIYFMFVTLCGMNYYRLDFEYYYGKEAESYSTEELKLMCIDYIEISGEIRENLNEEDFLVSVYTMSDNSHEAFNRLSETYEILGGFYSKPKPIILSEPMSYTKITGFFFPFTVEANVNVAVPDYQIPFTMLHEQAHQRGFMKEDEANFLAFLAGKESSDDLTKYSSYMSAVNYALNSLYDTDRDSFNEAYSYFNDLQLKDREESYLYWEQFEEQIVAETFTAVNDNYLKANGQSDGVISYGKVTELLLLDYYS